jgi:hypothetical protein
LLPEDFIARSTSGKEARKEREANFRARPFDFIAEVKIYGFDFMEIFAEVSMFMFCFTACLKNSMLFFSFSGIFRLDPILEYLFISSLISYFVKLI